MDYNNPEEMREDNGTVYQSTDDMYTGTYQQPERVEYSQYNTVPPQNNGVGAMAVISLVMGILSLLCCCVGLGAAFGIAGIILGSIAISRNTGKGVAIGGLVTSIIGTLLSVIVIIYYVFIGYSVAKNPELKQLMEMIEEGNYTEDDLNNFDFGNAWNQFEENGDIY